MPFYTPAQKQAIIRKMRREKRKRFLVARGVEASRAVEIQYLAAMKRIIQKLKNQVNSTLLPSLGQFEVDYVKDSPSLIVYFSSIVTQLGQQVGDIEETAESIASRMATATEAFNRRNFVKTINSAIGVNLVDIIRAEGVQFQIEAAVTENIDLIKTIPKEYHERIKKAVTQGINQGDDFFSIRKSILEIGESTDKRAKLIARDQVAKLNAAVTETRQKKMGITHYFWRTSRDERVRDTHKANADKRFAWDNPPSKTGHPGDDIQCRCTAEPDLSHLLRLS
jgi:SPP1 gp7 family putative phage head morphogenesis protein